MARILGIEIRVHLSWVLILAVITAGVASQLTASQPAWSDALRWGSAGAVSVLFFLSVLVHEVVHGVLARSRGMGVESVTLLFFGGSASPAGQASRPVDEAIAAASGPLASGFVAAVFLGIFFAAAPLPGSIGEAIAQVSIIVAALNAFLAALNMLPVYPLDGGRLLRAVIWRLAGSERLATRGAAIVNRVLGWAFIAGGIALMVTGDALDGVMLAIIGWFLGGSARSVESRLVLEDLLRGMRVESAMETGLPSVSPQLTLDTFAAQYLASGEGTSLPVMQNDALLGLIGTSQLRRVRRKAWPTMRAADVMVSLPALPTLGPDDELWGALERLRGAGADGLPVLRGHQLLGVLTRRSIVSVIQARSKPAAPAVPAVPGAP